MGADRRRQRGLPPPRNRGRLARSVRSAGAGAQRAIPCRRSWRAHGAPLQRASCEAGRGGRSRAERERTYRPGQLSRRHLLSNPCLLYLRHQVSLSDHDSPRPPPTRPRRSARARRPGRRRYPATALEMHDGRIAMQPGRVAQAASRNRGLRAVHSTRLALAGETRRWVRVSRKLEHRTPRSRAAARWVRLAQAGEGLTSRSPRCLPPGAPGHRCPARADASALSRRLTMARSMARPMARPASSIPVCGRGRA